MKKSYFFVGVAIFVILAIAYFIPISYTEQEGNIIAEVQTTLLGEIIFYSPWVLGFYVVIGIVLIVYGLKGKRLKIV